VKFNKKVASRFFFCRLLKLRIPVAGLDKRIEIFIFLI
jgi:hypothetical protein